MRMSVTWSMLCEVSAVSGAEHGMRGYRHPG